MAWIAFRESAKTSYAKLFVIWLIAYKKRFYINVDSFDKEKGWTHETAQEWVDEHSKMMVGDRCEVCYTADAGELFLTYWLTYDDLTNIIDMNKSSEMEDKDMNEVLNAITELKKLVEEKFEVLETVIKDYDMFFIKTEDLENNDEENLEIIKTENTDENYIKKLLEETNELLTKTISVQSL